MTTNTGNHNTGNSSTGYSNTGHSNTGNYNTGNHNTGCYNTGDRNTGHFNTGTPKTVRVFDGPEVDQTEFLKSLPSWLATVSPVENGQPISMREAYLRAWEGSDQNVAEVEAILGFNREVWIKITGLDLWSPPREIVHDGHIYVLLEEDE